MPGSALIHIAERLVRNRTVDGSQLRLALNQGEQLPPGEIVAAVEASVNLPHELQIIRCIDRPAEAAVIRDVVQEGNAKAARRGASLKLCTSGVKFYAFVEIRHDVLAVERFMSFLPGTLERGERAKLHI